MEARTPFVGRRAEVEYVLQHIHALCHGTAPQICLLNLCGVYGIGKSALLQELAQRATAYEDLVCLTLRLPALPMEAKALTLAARQAIIHQLHPADGELPPDDATADGALAACAAALLRRRAPILLLIEAEERHATLAFGWIERGLLLPLVRANRLVAPITSHAPLRWRELDTRRRAESRALTPLSLQETANHLALTQSVAATLYPFTRGLPLANAVARVLLEEAPDPLRWSDATQGELLARIAQQLYARVGPELTNDLRCACETLAVAREFTIPLLQQLLTLCAPPEQPRNQAFQLMLVRQLQELDLVVWEQQSNSWRVVPMLRQIIAKGLRYHDPQRYQQIQQLACSYYRQMLDEVIVARHLHLAELLWHTMERQHTNGTTAADLLRHFVRTYLVSPDGQQVDYAALNALRNRLLTDFDQSAAFDDQTPNLAALVAILDQTMAELV